MPQTLTDSWKAALGDDWETHSRPIVAHGRQSHLDRLQCAAVRMVDYSRKREILLTSHLELNKYFSAVTDWNEQSIRHRAEVLAETALKVWSYFGSEQPEAALPLQGVRGTTPRSLTILGQTFSVSTWREVIQITLETIAELDYDRFGAICSRNFRGSQDATRQDFVRAGNCPTAHSWKRICQPKSIHRSVLTPPEVSGLSSEECRVE